MERQCSKCKCVKDVSEFYTYKRNTPKGFGYRSCKKCTLEYIKIRRKTHPNIYKNIDRKNYHRDCYYSWAMSSIQSHRRRGVKVNFSIKELRNIAKNRTNCPFCSTRFSWQFNKKIKDNSPSLDNTNCKKEIFLSDVDIICYNCNRTKGKRTIEEFKIYCSHIASLYHQGISQFNKESDLLNGSTDTPRGDML